MSAGFKKVELSNTFLYQYDDGDAFDAMNMDPADSSRGSRSKDLLETCIGWHFFSP